MTSDANDPVPEPASSELTLDNGVVIEPGTVRRIVRACHRRMGSPLSSADLDDILQSVRLTCWQRRGTFAGRSSPESWIYGIARLTILRHLRQERVRRDAIASAGSDELDRLDGEAEPQRSDGSSVQRIVREALYAAGSTVALIVRGRYVNGLSFLEIGKRTGRSESAVKARYYRALPRLRQRLRRYWRRTRR